jgi:hypothetical protein
MQIGGGLGEEYMHAPSLQVGGGGGGKGGGGFLANLLDLLGVHRQVAKGPKDEKGGVPNEAASKDATHSGGKAIDPRGGAPEFTPMMGASTTTPQAAPPPAMTILDDADAAFSVIRPRVGKFGSGGFSFLPNTLR